MQQKLLKYWFTLLHFVMNDPIGPDMVIMSVRLHVILAVHQFFGGLKCWSGHVDSH